MNKYLEKIATQTQRSTPADKVKHGAGVAFGGAAGLMSTSIADTQIPVHALSRKADILARRAERKKTFYPAMHEAHRTGKTYEEAIRANPDTAHEAGNLHSKAVAKKLEAHSGANKIGQKAYENMSKKLRATRTGIRAVGLIGGALAGHELFKKKFD